MAEVKVKLSNGEEVVVKPLTMRQARACNFSKIINKVMKSYDEETGKITEFLISEDELINVIKQVYPKAEDLIYADAIELFNAIVQVAMEKN